MNYQGDNEIHNYILNRITRNVVSGIKPKEGRTIYQIKTESGEIINVMVKYRHWSAKSPSENRHWNFKNFSYRKDCYFAFACIQSATEIKDNIDINDNNIKICLIPPDEVDKLLAKDMNGGNVTVQVHLLDPNEPKFNVRRKELPSIEVQGDAI